MKTLTAVWEGDFVTITLGEETITLSKRTSEMLQHALRRGANIRIDQKGEKCETNP